jgi:hypothetical protein
MTRFNGAVRSLTVGEFSQFVQSTNQLLNIDEATKITQMTTRDTSTDAYKCVPLDPDLAVENGQLQVDLATGQPLKQVLADREAEKGAAGASTSSASPGRIERILSSVLGVTLIIVAVASIIIGVSQWWSGRAAATAAGASGAAVEPPSSSLASKVEWGALTVVMLIISAVIGVIIGATLG